MYNVPLSDGWWWRIRTEKLRSILFTFFSSRGTSFVSRVGPTGAAFHAGMYVPACWASQSRQKSGNDATGLLVSFPDYSGAE